MGKRNLFGIRKRSRPTSQYSERIITVSNGNNNKFDHSKNSNLTGIISKVVVGSGTEFVCRGDAKSHAAEHEMRLEPCYTQSSEYLKCLKSISSDVMICQSFLDSLNSCKIEKQLYNI